MGPRVDTPRFRPASVSARNAYRPGQRPVSGSATRGLCAGCRRLGRHTAAGAVEAVVIMLWSLSACLELRPWDRGGCARRSGHGLARHRALSWTRLIPAAGFRGLAARPDLVEEVFGQVLMEGGARFCEDRPLVPVALELRQRQLEVGSLRPRVEDDADGRRVGVHGPGGPTPPPPGSGHSTISVIGRLDRMAAR